MDLKKLTLTQLARLESQIAAEVKRRESDKKAKVLAEVKKLAKQAGVPLSELLSGKTSKRGRPAGSKSSLKGKKVPPKYRNPANHAETWTGRGRQPAWVAAYLKGGKKIENLLIKGAK